MYFLDTNICVYFISRKFPSVTRRFREHDPKELFISALVAGELANGIEHSTRAESNRTNLDIFLQMMQVVPWEKDVMWHFGLHKSRLKKLGQKIGEMDLLIGCHALAKNATMVTNNTREFERIEGLKLENWVE